MDYIIDGGARLFGEIAVYGAKNCALPLLGASVLTSDTVVLRNCPQIVDVLNMLKLLQAMGKKVAWTKDAVEVSGELTATKAPREFAKLLRGSALVLGSVLSRYGEINLPLPGGCAIGARPMDIHLDGLEHMGVEVHTLDSELHCSGRPKAADYSLRFASVGATENLLCASVLSDGETTLHNCATEPEVEALERLLVEMGGKIDGIGTPNLTIKGVTSLHGAEFTVIPDRIVTATYISAAVAAGGKITVTHCNPSHLRAYLNMLYQHFDIREYADAITIKCDSHPKGYGRIHTAPYPFFHTDTQSLALSLAAMSDGGRTTVCENLFESRLTPIADELNKMGARITVKGNCATVTGQKLHCADVIARDLRGGAALVVAGLNATGRTTVSGAQNICRGYLDLAGSLSSIGANITVKQ